MLGVLPAAEEALPAPADAEQHINDEIDEGEGEGEYNVEAGTCSICLESAVEFRCVDCPGTPFLCAEDRDRHLRFPACASHRIVDFDTDIRLLVSPACARHPHHRVEYACIDDRALLCVDCFVTEHAGHRCAGIAEALSRFDASNPRKYVEILARHGGSLGELLDTASKVSNTVNETFRKEAKALTRATQSIKRHLDELEREAQEKLERVAEQQQELVSLHITRLEAQKQHCDMLAAALKSDEAPEALKLKAVFEQEDLKVEDLAVDGIGSFRVVENSSSVLEALEKWMTVTEYGVSVAMSTVEGRGVGGYVVGEAMEFTVTARGADGAVLPGFRGFSMVLDADQYEEALSYSCSAAVSGVQTVSYTAAENVGTIRISVLKEELHVAQSPYCVAPLESGGWNTATSGEGVEFPTAFTAVFPAHPAIAVGSVGFLHGRCTWKITITKFSNWSWIGILKHPVSSLNMTLGSDSNCSGFSKAGNANVKLGTFVSSFKRMKTKDELTFILDMTAHTLMGSVNGATPELLLVDLPEGPIFPAASNNTKPGECLIEYL